MSTLTDLATNYLTAVTAKDLDAVASFFTDDVVLLGPAGPTNGKPEVRTAIGNLVNAIETLAFTTLGMYEQESTVVVETSFVSNGNTAYNVHILTFTNEKISGIKLYTLQDKQ